MTFGFAVGASNAAQVRGRLEKQLKRRAAELEFEVAKKAAEGDSPVSSPPPSV